MRFPWKRKKVVQVTEQESNESLNEIQPDDQEAVIVETENATTKSYNHRSHTGNIHWMDDLIMEHQKQGGFDHLSGKGKPLNFEPKTDVFDGILKNAGAVPPWIAFQQEIRADIQRAITSMKSQSTFDLDNAIAQINEKIRKYNTQCPSPLLQKRVVSANDIVQRLDDW